jgi:hypothetical protein
VHIHYPSLDVSLGGCSSQHRIIVYMAPIECVQRLFTLCKVVHACWFDGCIVLLKGGLIDEAPWTEIKLYTLCKDIPTIQNALEVVACMSMTTESDVAWMHTNCTAIHKLSAVSLVMADWMKSFCNTIQQ